jgi:hypothetical protein
MIRTSYALPLRRWPLLALLLVGCGTNSANPVSNGDAGALPEDGSATLPETSTGEEPDADTGAIQITTTSLPMGDLNAPYAASLTATGGQTPYTWSLSAGTLPAGLSLAAAQGTISGTPTVSGTSTFTVKVTDSSSPILTATKPFSISVSKVWYVRPDGGTRYTAARVAAGMSAQCDGLADVAYSGSGTNQHCAFNDFRFMWDDESGQVGAGAWVIAGGDTVLIRGCTAGAGQSNPANPTCRIGWDAPTGSGSNQWCYGVGSYTCYNPPIPAGTALQHTRILGENYAACNTGGATNPKVYASNLTQLFGGFSLSYTFNLQDTQNVDVQCIELTTHNGQCTLGGSPAYPRGCSNNQPLDDYAQNGFVLNDKSANVSFQDVYVHGFNASGFYGPIGAAITLTRVFDGFNGFAGWNFQDNADTPNAPSSTITASYVTMIGNGCYEQYPIKNPAFPAQSCYDDVSNGFGDSWSGQDTTLTSFTCDHCTQMYNTKDGFIGPHAAIASLTITNSTSIGNMGQQWKWGTQTNATTLFQNNVTVGNCARMSEALPGAAQNFALSTGLGGSYLSDFCRAAGNTFDILTQIGSKNYFYGNTIVMAGPTGMDLDCGPAGGGATNCGSVLNLWENNNFLGYTDPGIGTAPGLWYITPGSNVVVTSSYNNESGIRDGDTCGVNHVTCVDPFMLSAPASPWPGTQSDLDAFNPFVGNNSLYPGSSSPLIGAGLAVGGLTKDYYGATRRSPPTIGAVEP